MKTRRKRVKYAQGDSFARKDIFAQGTFKQRHFYKKDHFCTKFDNSIRLVYK